MGHNQHRIRGKGCTRLMGTYLMGTYLMGTYLMGTYLMEHGLCGERYACVEVVCEGGGRCEKGVPSGGSGIQEDLARRIWDGWWIGDGWWERCHSC